MVSQKLSSYTLGRADIVQDNTQPNPSAYQSIDMPSSTIINNHEESAQTSGSARDTEARLNCECFALLFSSPSFLHAVAFVIAIFREILILTTIEERIPIWLAQDAFWILLTLMMIVVTLDFGIRSPPREAQFVAINYILISTASLFYTAMTLFIRHMTSDQTTALSKSSTIVGGVSNITGL